MSRGRGPRGGRAVPEGVHVDYPPNRRCRVARVRGSSADERFGVQHRPRADDANLSVNSGAAFAEPCPPVSCGFHRRPSAPSPCRNPLTGWLSALYPGTERENRRLCAHRSGGRAEARKLRQGGRVSRLRSGRSPERRPPDMQALRVSSDLAQCTRPPRGVPRPRRRDVPETLEPLRSGEKAMAVEWVVAVRARAETAPASVCGPRTAPTRSAACMRPGVGAKPAWVSWTRPVELPYPPNGTGG